MKITTLILFLAIMQVSATSLAQKVTLNANNAQLSTVFQQIRSQTGYDFAYTTKTLENAKLVTINVKNEELSDVLTKIFDKQPLDFTVQDKFVTVTVKQPTILDKLRSALNLDNINVTGQVVGENNQPLSGATVTVKGTNIFAVTDVKGYFTLQKIQKNVILEVTFIGYDKKDVNAVPDLGVIKMTIAEDKLDEVQVIAYGTTTGRLSTGDVTTVSSKVVEEQPVSNPLAALQDRVPGLLITQQTGVVGGGFNVQIRGQNSIFNGNDPLYVIDGVPYESELLANLGQGIRQAGSPLFYINPDDIESISVLKDADETSIYGSRAANGVILITTKKGKAGATTVNINFNQGVSSVAENADMLNTQQYLTMRNDAFKNDGATPGQFDYDVNGTWNQNSDTNWQKVLDGNTAQFTDVQGTVSGGNDNTQFLIGGGYHRETTVFPGDLNDQKGSIHINLSNTSTDQKFKITFSANYVSDISDLIGGDPTSYNLLLPPDAPAIYNSNGTLNWANSTWSNPLAILTQKYNSTVSNLIANSVISYQFFQGFLFKVNLGYTNLQTNENSITPTTFFDPAFNVTSGTSTFSNDRISTWNIEPQFSYDLKVGKSKFSALVGSTILQNTSNAQLLNATGYSSDALLGNLAGASSITVNPSSGYDQYRYNSLFARLNYNLSDKYIVDLTGREDGSSRFGPGKQFADFGSVGVAWVFSKEDFVAKTQSFLSFGKLRFSYGTTGNDQIGDYKFLSLYNSTPYPYEGTQGLVPVSLYNPDYGWEVTKKIEGGLDLGFLQDRILITASYYYNRSSNQLIPYPLPSITGFNSILENLPAIVQNTGLELSVNTANIKTKNFSWSSAINFTAPDNKLIAYPGLSSSSEASTLVIGQPLNVFRVFHMIGVNPQTGVYEFDDSKGNPTYTPSYSTDRFVNINTNPKFYGGFQNSFKYKYFQLDFSFQYVKKTSVNDLFATIVPPGIGGYYSVPTYVYNNAWQKPGDKASIEKFTQSYSSPAYNAWQYAQNSDASFSDGSYIRLKNVSFSYSFPSELNQRLHLKNARVYVQGENLLVFTHYKGWDPEVQGFGTVPPLRVLTGGIQFAL